MLVEQVNGWTYTQMLMEMDGCMKGWLDECADENVCPWVGQCTDLQGVLVCSPLSAAAVLSWVSHYLSCILGA